MISLSLTLYWAEEREIRQRNRLEQQAVLNTLVHIAGESVLTNDDLLLVKYVRWLHRWTPTLTRASVVNIQGDVLAHSEPKQIGHLLDAKTSETPVIVLSAPIRLGTTWHGTASIAFSEVLIEKTIQSRLHELKKRLLHVMAWLFPLGLCVSFYVALSWTRPVKGFVRLTEEIGKGRWNVSFSPWVERKDELGELARSFQDMTEQLGQLDQMKEDFVSAVTHELRSPLGAIESYLNVIAQERQEGVPTPAWENYLERIRLNTQRLNRFVNDLLDVAALERGKVKLECQTVDLVVLAQDVLGLFALKLQEKSLSYDVKAPPTRSHAYADPEKIRHVLINLVSNAIKFTPPGGHVSIAIEPGTQEGTQAVSVCDTGVGISESDQGKIFNKFEQVATARKHIKGAKGTGLGLSISKALIELHGQILTVQSRPGEGSAFSFMLPNRAALRKAPL